MEDLLTKFYSSFQKMEAESMIDCYHEEIVFNDPAFGELRGEKAKNMWRMLCENAKDLNIDFSDIQIKDNKGSAHWEAQYTFSQTGRKVHNIITAQFEFKDGKIIKHTDDFNLYKWSKQAMGFKGFLLGNTNFFKKKLQIQTSKLLSRFEQKG